MHSRDVACDSVFFRAFQDEPSPLAVTQPPGAYSVTGNLFPAVVETMLVVGRERTECTLVNPARGRVTIAVRDEAGNPVPGKVTFFGLHPTRSPYFQPHDTVKSGLSWERFKNSVFPGLEDLELELPVGTYLVSASRGPEHTLNQTVVEVLSDELTTLRLLVDRVVDTEGLVAVEVHIEVRAAPWIPVDEVRVIVNRETLRVLPVEAAPSSVQRLRRTLRLELTEDAFIVVEVRGKGSLFPVVQQSSESGLKADAVGTYALTNPVFMDVDGNGRFDPPLPGGLEEVITDTR